MRPYFLADRLLLGAMIALAFLLGCYELFDQDVYWHLRTGQWILEHHHVPSLDIFTYTSPDRPWIDLHWGFQVLLAWAFRLGGVAGMIVLAATSAAAAFAIALNSRGRTWPLWISALCALPALALMAARFDPRPEILSLLLLAATLAVLFRSERRPILVWILVPIQIIWVNCHSLFVLEPIIVACYVLAHAWAAWRANQRPPIEIETPSPRFWHHMIPASIVVLVACLINPYGVHGALFPLELFPKISDPANPYKKYVDEFISLRSAVLEQVARSHGVDLHMRIHLFLLVLLPWSFCLPALDRLTRVAAPDDRDSPPASFWPWVVMLATAFGVSLLAALTAPFRATPHGLVTVGQALAIVVVLSGIACAAWLRSQFHRGAIAALVMFSSMAAWQAWMFTFLFTDDRRLASPTYQLLSLAALGLLAASALWIANRAASLFRVLIVVAFSYLSFQAVRNINLFALVTGTVLTWNLGEWVRELSERRAATWYPPGLSWSIRGLIFGSLAIWMFALVTDRYYQLEGGFMHFALSERPLTFAHQAARFAAQPGLPAKALVFDLGQTGVYIYHNAPERKIYMDARLEVPDRATFENYVRLEQRLNANDARWPDGLSRTQAGLVLLNHDGETEAEASLLRHPDWHCVYYDPIASLFVRSGSDWDRAKFPPLNFAGSWFGDGKQSHAALEPRLALAEAATLVRLAYVLRKRVADPWTERLPLLLRAADLAKRVISTDPNSGPAWRILGQAKWEMVPDLIHPPPGPDDPWDPATGLPWAMLTYCFERGRALSPDDPRTRDALETSFKARRMKPAPDHASGSAASAIEGQGGWAKRDQAAVRLLHLGRPQAAVSLWETATDAPSRALRLTRIATARLAGLDSAAAEREVRRAIELDPKSGESWFVLVAALIETGRAREASAGCAEALKRELTEAQRAWVLGTQRLLIR